MSKIEFGKDEENSVDIPKAVVAYLDVLGFASKRHVKELEAVLQDFIGPLTTAAEENASVRINVFSDCAFMATSVESASDLIACLRYAFESWAADGLMIRGGLAVGSYHETKLSSLAKAPKNLVGSLFAGSGVVAAARTEAQGEGALLFASEECARLMQEKYAEPIYALEKRLVIGWTDKESTLYWFTGISLLRLMQLLERGFDETNSVVIKFRNNILYACNATKSTTPYYLVVSILHSSIPTDEGRDRARRLVRIPEPSDGEAIRAVIDEAFKHQNIRLLRTLAEFDSSVFPDAGHWQHE